LILVAGKLSHGSSVSQQGKAHQGIDGEDATVGRTNGCPGNHSLTVTISND
jgi:hypothetical protein